MDDPSNKGLEGTIAASQNLYKLLKPDMSYGDFLALLGTEALKSASDDQGSCHSQVVASVLCQQAQNVNKIRCSVWL